MTIAHALIKVGKAEHAAIVNFYTQALKPLGSKQLASFPNGLTGFGSESPEWWIGIGDTTSSVHVAFRAPDRATVVAFYSAAIDAGAKDNGPPGVRAHVHPNYYAEFIFDPAGNNIEAMCMVPESS
ncbi:glyoxalase bleomycin resistance dioxygenase [Fusarium albosuccineum]|uniref:Glyoxalase bleomycin resistance dioxygenase n=1 Tax=Fusarium albosuccineum TaxID=1237068 RepID=A0A8H4PG88_9HYPO|nr:glyoxalase bleomycin resistance dioxygenase [Fusarium albosuccineum]